MSNNISIRSVVKKYGDFCAVDNVSIEIQAGELFTLLGPSGCGKTTLLRMIAGFNDINQGEIIFDDKVVNNIPPHKRDIGMVFQNYAIFPHLSVEDNVAYGLKARKLDKNIVSQRTLEGMELVQISEYSKRMPSQLSGGQQQRVALARATVIHPKLLLMDEPLSNLDAKLRVEMRVSIKKLQKNLNITTVYVTHDQEEALAISDRIAVMNKGKIEQLGTPKEIYMHPANRFVASFIGTSHFLDCDVNGEGIEVEGKAFPLKLKQDYQGKGLLALRPEHVTLSPPSDNLIEGTVTLATFLGEYINYEITLPSGNMIEVNEYSKISDNLYSNGEKVGLSLAVSKLNLFDKDGKEALV